MKKNRLLVTSISKDMGLFSPTNSYSDANRILNCESINDRLQLKASFKRYGDRVYNVWYEPHTFRFYGMEDMAIYDVNIDNNSFIITEMKDENGESCIKKIKFLDYNNTKSVSVENIYIDNHDKNEYICIKNSNGTKNTNNTVVSPDEEKVKQILRTLLESEEDDIRNSFDLINDSIPNFFNDIKYDFRVLNNFNELNEKDKIYAKPIMRNLMNNKTRMK